MAVSYFPEVFVFATLFSSTSSGVTVEVLDFSVYPYPSTGGTLLARYMNKVWDSVAGGWVSWETGFEDVDGLFYPGPGSYGVDTSLYRVEWIEFEEEV